MEKPFVNSPVTVTTYYCSSITNDGKVVVAGGEDGVVRIWNAADAKVISTFQAMRIPSV